MKSTNKKEKLDYKKMVKDIYKLVESDWLEDMECKWRLHDKPEEFTQIKENIIYPFNQRKNKMKQKTNNSNNWSILVDRFEKIRSLIKNIKVAQYNNKGVNIGYKEGTDVVLDFISSELQRERLKTLKEVEGIMKKLMDKKRCKQLADNLELFNGQRSCKICGYNPEKQRHELLSKINNLKNNDPKGEKEIS